MNTTLLKSIGLSDGEVKVYTAVLQLGVSSLHKIQEKTGIERRNIYDILNKLIQKGLISYTVENKKRTYQITHPDKILDYLSEKKRVIETQRDEIKEMLPDLMTVFKEKKIPIRAEVLRGNEAMKAMLNEMLDYPASYWIGGNSGVEKTNLNHWWKHWMNRRAKKRRWLYDLADHGTCLEGLEPNKVNKKYYYKHCWLPKNLSSPMIMVIYGNKAAQILWSEQSFAFVLESKEIKESFMKYFEYFWKE